MKFKRRTSKKERKCCSIRPRDITLYKVDAVTGRCLPGAVFQMTCPNGTVMTTVSDHKGRIKFCVLPEEIYILTEIEVPAGYMYMPYSYVISVSRGGKISVNGECFSKVMLPNIRISSFSFLKTDEFGVPLAEAEFSLTQNGNTIVTAVSGEDGIVTFENLIPGIYVLVETEAPDNFINNYQTYTVVVDGCGGVTINGRPAEDFVVRNAGSGVKSHPPIINPILQGSGSVSGIGSPGCTLTVIWPNNTQSNFIIGGTGEWTVQVPNDVAPLLMWQTVLAYQTCPGMSPSSIVSMRVFF